MIELLKKLEPLNLEKTKFIGYENLDASAKVLGLYNKEGIGVQHLTGTGFVIFDQTPFYAISGGQDSDKGHLIFNQVEIEIIDVRKDVIPGYFIHEVNLSEQELRIGDLVDLRVCADFRYNSSLNHSALHITWQTILNNVGHYVEELGSKLNDERYQLQFCNDEMITPQLVLKAVEQINSKTIPEKIKSKIFFVTQEEAEAKNYLFEFTKIAPGEMVRMVEFPGIVIEPCSGTHIDSTEELKKIWFMNFTKTNKAVIIDMTTNPAVAKNYFKTKLEDRLKEIESQISKALEAGMRDSFDEQLKVARNLVEANNYIAIKELNEIGLNITALINKFLKNLEQENIKQFLSQDFQPKIIKDKFYYIETSNENYTNKLLISKASLLANENPEKVIILANQGQTNSNAVLVCNQKANFNVKLWFDEKLADKTGFKGGGGPLIIQIFSPAKEDFKTIKSALEE
ncbi:alanyl-tRNA synthetase [Spiroplasma sabaudiense Ar-1343]|uniref:Alanyl-tRNA synthetase n=1 Tax=Spiroplasma sabaudiense Ar-1343 TaxID=1276257 RepID=W6A8X6_9MOLU|nr:alanine--tRNA ligase-related protein [Spiroplasma sabaudiense]AHI53603.1 alanyl-tRNA synthetase [Spiroplasma sabaudiense Ar-1343]